MNSNTGDGRPDSDSAAASGLVDADLRAVLARGLAPRAVAVYGVSDRPSLKSQGTRIANAVLSHGYSDRIALVNPRAQTVHGIATVPRARDSELAGQLDFAVISVPRTQVPAAMDDCLDAGIKLAIITSAGFGESDETGVALQAAMLERRERGLRFFGPNCMGLINFADGLYASSPPFLPPAAGPVSLFGQSGSLSVRLMQIISAECGQGLDLWATMGNSADLDIPAMLSHTATRDTTSVAVVYLESITAPDRLRSAIEDMRAAGKEVVLLKAGRSEVGGAAAASHTGAMSSPDTFVDVLAEDTGCVRVDSVREAAQVASILATVGRPRGPFGVVGFTGGDSVMAADTCAALGLPLSRLSETTKAKMGAAVPQASTTNPVDVTPFAWGSGHESDLLRAVARDSDTGAMVMTDGWKWRYDDGSLVPPAEFSSFFKDLALGVPVIQDSVVSPEELQALVAAGVAVTRDGETIWRSLARITRAAPSDAASLAETPAVPAKTSGAAARERSVPELEALQQLRAAGLPMVPAIVVDDAESLGQAAADLGFPVVLKGLIPGVTHKAVRQLVQIGISSLEEAETVRERMAADVHAEGGVVVVQPHILDARAEVIIGTQDDPAFGVHVMVGEGGKWADREPDNAWAKAPVDADRARRMLAKTRIGRRLLADPPGSRDIDGLIEAIVRVSEIAIERRSEIAELEINPLLVRSRSVVAVDAVIMPR